MGVNDSRGFNTGFGDSGLGGGPSRPLRVLPRAFWFTRDGRYLWALRHYQRLNGREYENPFHRDVTPVPDTEHIGLRIFPMTRGVYDFTQTFPWRGEGRKPPNIPFEQSFDKAVFRENWEGDGQYLMLDGYARGHHLHYDGNAIITLVDRGRRWLIDHDYLIRNTTEHNMLTVIRDGRADETVPSCSALLSSGQGERLGITVSETRDYTGIDWRRTIVWLKGTAFLVLDQCTARAAGSYALDFTWKTVDMAGEHVVEPGVFLVDRPGALAVNRDIHVTSDPGAGNGKAIVMARNSSIWSLAVDLPPGEYRPELIARARDTGSDSLHMFTVSGDKVDHHLPKTSYGPSSSQPDHSTPAPTVTLAQPEIQVLTFTMREHAPVYIDRIVFRDPSNEVVLELEAEDARQPEKSDLPTTGGARFWLKCADPVSMRVTRHTTRGISVPLTKLWQRSGGQLGDGGVVEVGNLLYTETAEDPLDLTVTRVAPGMVLVDGDVQALVATGVSDWQDLSTDADVVVVGPDRVAFSGGTRLRVGTAVFERGERGYLERLIDAEFKPGARELLTQARTHASSQPRAEIADTADPAVPIWRWETPGGSRIDRLEPVDLDGDGRDELLVAAGTALVAVDAAGRVRWQRDFDGIVHDVSAGEAAPDAGNEVVVGCGNNTVYLLDARGSTIRSVPMMTPHRYQQEYGDKVPSTPLAVAILNTDGTPRVFAANTNYDLVTYDTDLKQINIARQFINHGGIDLWGRDVNGDGKLEVFCTNHYGSLCCADHLGNRVWSYYTSIGDMQAGLGDLDSDGRIEAVYGSSTGMVRCLTFEPVVPFQQATESQWVFGNYGYATRRIQLADVNGDGKDEAIVAMGTGYVYALDIDGRVLWQTAVGVDAVDVVV
jgi:outer membrane protein assembly factor BamB